MKQPFRYLKTKKEPEQILQFLNSKQKFYPVDLQNFFKTTGLHIYRCFSEIKKAEDITTAYITSAILKKYLID